MPIRLILVLLLVIFEGAFIGFNLDNVCNVWFFKEFEAVPVCITVLIAFVAGVSLSIIFFAFGRKRQRAVASGATKSAEGASPSDDKKKRLGGRLKEKSGGTSASSSPQKGTPSFGYPDSLGTGAGGSAYTPPFGNSAGGGKQGGI